MTKSKKITGGLYLVLNPDMDRNILLEKLEHALNGGVEIIQIWNNWPDLFSASDKKNLISDITDISSRFDLPVLINEEWELLKETDLDGVHFDKLPENFNSIKSEIKRDLIIGVTCGNDLNIIYQAVENGVDYISFCSMFPSASVSSCEIVSSETVRKARKITQLPLFVSGGITPENLTKLKDLNIDGAAVISGIMNSDAPKKSALDYKRTLEKLRTS
ncbi:thiamine phosphate synthase [soil metagenome]